MTRKDYIAVAKAINETIADSNSVWGVGSYGAYVALDTVMLVAEKFVKLFENDNSNFDRQRFIDACLVLKLGASA